MMRFWLSRDTSIPIREQLSAQLLLGILSRRLAPGARLPSVRELARRLRIHANTVSSVYQDLAARGWVTQRRGSGVYVRGLRVSGSEGELEAFVRGCIEEGLAQGFSLERMRSAFALATAEPAEQKFMVVDPDPEFARILSAEIAEATGLPISYGGLEVLPAASGTCVLVNAPHLSRVTALTGASLVRVIRVKSMQDVIQGQQRPASSVLIGVVTRSSSIRQWSSTLLSALGFPPDSVVQRDPGESGWQEGLHACDILAADVVSSAAIPRDLHVHTFRVVDDEFLSEMRALLNPAVVTAEKV